MENSFVLIVLFFAALATGGLIVNWIGLGRAMSRLSVSAYVEFHQHTNRTFDPYMPIVVIGALAGGIALALIYGVHSIPGQLATTGAVCYALVGELIPVLAPIAQNEDGETYNVNADTFAGAIAGALKAKRLLLLTDVQGVLGRDGNLIKEMRSGDIHGLIADGTITGGMIPKVETCIHALEQGVEGVVILDGKMPHAVLIELLTDHGAGTLITR